MYPFVEQYRLPAAPKTEQIVVMDFALLTENPREGLQGIVVVDVPEETQVERLVRFRGFDEADARARIARQATREARLATADFVIDNGGPVEALAPQIERLWAWVTSLPQLPLGATGAGARTDGV